jgi:hypothetical protein
VKGGAATPVAAPDSQPIELFPSGISVSNVSNARPVLILKDQTGTEVLPVWMNALDAGIALAELSQGSGATPHMVSRRLMESLQVKLESCTFSELVGHHQFVQLAFSGAKGNGGALGAMRVRADEAMSFCIQSRAKFYSTRSFMARCRDLDADISRLEQNLENGVLPELQSEIENSTKKSPYVM